MRKTDSTSLLRLLIIKTFVNEMVRSKGLHKFSQPLPVFHNLITALSLSLSCVLRTGNVGFQTQEIVEARRFLPRALIVSPNIYTRIDGKS